MSPFVRHNLRPLWAGRRPQDLRDVAEHLAAGRITPAVDRAFALSEAAAAIRYLQEGRARGKVVLTI